MNKHKNDKHDKKNEHEAHAADVSHNNNAHKPEEKLQAENAEARQEKKTVTLTPEERQNLEESAKKAAENQDKYLRAVADLENYRKRAQKEKEDLLKYCNGDFIKGLLPILDNFDRAIVTMNESADIAKIKEGIDLITRQFHKYLEQLGLARVPAVGEVFDPHKHQAVMHVETDEHPENIVVEELQRGYTLNDRLLRPAMVKVAKEKQKS